MESITKITKSIEKSDIWFKKKIYKVINKHVLAIISNRYHEHALKYKKSFDPIYSILQMADVDKFQLLHQTKGHFFTLF